MKIYLVGGAVRDQLLGLPVKERDWVVVGATVADMLKQNFRQVGKEFPVFIHPKTGEEYALARMERKVAPGYKGFTFDATPKVSLENDLLRRDLTINAMAQTPDGDLVDPYHGKDDLDKKILRHVSSAFAEDPVRILRVGRLLARYYYLGFQIAEETIALMTRMVKAGEVDALVAERVWKELERALGEKNPEQFFWVLDKCGALPTLFPEIAKRPDCIDWIAANTGDNKHYSDVRFAVLLHTCDKTDIAALCKRYRVPNDYHKLAILVSTHYTTALNARQHSAEELIRLFGTLDIYRRYERFKLFIAACQMIANATDKSFETQWLLNCARVAKGYNVQQLIADGFQGNKLAAKLREERMKAVEEWLEKGRVG